VVILTLATLFVAPLDNGQQQKSLFQTIINNAISTAQFNNISPAQQLATPTATPALLTNEGYCGGSDIWGSCATAVTSSGTMGTGKMQSPLQGAIITQVFANPEYQQWCGCWRPHTGIDLAAAYGTPVMAADSGQVIWTGWDWSGLGWAVKINHGHYIATIYGHLARFIVNVGQNVTKGQVIAYEGSTGASTGPHVHFMVLVNNIWVDPANYAPLP
jgi:murein DD-endopeptidase MepM/ murein hydrolase activator NlpD